jgi:hypothetical protein
MQNPVTQTSRKARDPFDSARAEFTVLLSGTCGTEMSNQLVCAARENRPCSCGRSNGWRSARLWLRYRLTSLLKRPLPSGQRSHFLITRNRQRIHHGKLQSDATTKTSFERSSLPQVNRDSGRPANSHPSFAGFGNRANRRRPRFDSRKHSPDDR